MPLSAPDELLQLAAGCKPLNVFGSFLRRSRGDAERQRQALDYAFIDTSSDGAHQRCRRCPSTPTARCGRAGRGPADGRLRLRVARGQGDNRAAPRGDSFYLRADLARCWADAFGGKTACHEGYTELNMPLVSGVPGVNLLAVNVGAALRVVREQGRRRHDRRVGHAGHVLNWKFSTVFEPFDLVRFRLTRSRDLRAAGLSRPVPQPAGHPRRVLRHQPVARAHRVQHREPDRALGQVRVGNPNLKTGEERHADAGPGAVAGRLGAGHALVGGLLQHPASRTPSTRRSRR